ncbi:protein kinase C iota type-like [Homalodisca vitripennis]|uniref:protein kinase C iota type-like n=1 Tax=Homalodisca vitripennis TaxID=197043 RepID=UPI001EEC4A2F|nr:protein kinase C iota type-like [Homalodisca vitripennis]
MPTQLAANSEVPEIRVKTAYNGEVMITYIDPHITVDQLCQEMRDICRFQQDQVFTMKWVDEEGDPCTISTQMELDEAIRLYEVNKDSELTIHEWLLSNTTINIQYLDCTQNRLDWRGNSSSIIAIPLVNKYVGCSAAFAFSLFLYR